MRQHIKTHKQPPAEIPSETKYMHLSVTISTDLSWKRHTNIVATKAFNTLDFLRRNLKISVISAKDQALKILVRPQLEYAC